MAKERELNKETGFFWLWPYKLLSRLVGSPKIHLKDFRGHQGNIANAKKDNDVRISTGHRIFTK